MKTLLALNRKPYDRTDVTWNALRLGEELLDIGTELRVFLLNDSMVWLRRGLRLLGILRPD